MLLRLGAAAGGLEQVVCLTIQPAGLDCAQEELGAVGAWSGIGHGQHTYRKMSLTLLDRLRCVRSYQHSLMIITACCA